MIHTQLADIIAQLEHAEGRLRSLEQTVPPERWGIRADQGRWSVGECIAHLNLTSAAYIPRMRVALDEARALPSVRGRRYRRDPKGWFLSLMIGPLFSIGGRKFGRVKTTPDFVPRSGEPVDVLVADFRRFQAELTSLARDADDLAVDRVFIVSPFGNRLRYNCWSAFVILPRHQERHLDQAAGVWTHTAARDR